MLLPLALLLTAATPLTIDRCGDVVVPAGAALRADSLRLLARCGGAVRVEGTIHLSPGGTLEARGERISVTGRLDAAGARVTLESPGPVVLAGELHARSLDERGASLSASGVLDVGQLSATNADHAIVFSADTMLSADVTDTGDIVIATGVTVTLTTGSQPIKFTADSDGDGAGSFLMQGTAQLQAGFRALTINASGASQLSSLTNAFVLLLDSLGPASQTATMTLNGPLNVAGSLTLKRQTLVPMGNEVDASSLQLSGGAFLGDTGPLVVRGAVTIGDGLLRAPSTTMLVFGDWEQRGGRFDANGGTVTFAGAGNKTVSFGIDPFQHLSNDSGSPLTFKPTWPDRQRIDVDQRRVADGGHRHLTIPIRIRGAHPVFTGAQPTGADLAFTDAWRNRLPHEVERFVTTPGQEELLAWVNVDTLWSDHDAPIYLHWGNAFTGPQADLAGTWDPSYLGVFHLAEAAGATVARDSSPAKNDGQIVGAQAGAPGELGTSYDFAPGQRVRLPSWVNPASLSVEAWVQPRSLMGLGGGNRILDADWFVNGSWAWYAWQGTSTDFIAKTDAGAGFGSSEPHVYAAGQWASVAATFGAQGGAGFANGVSTATRGDPPDGGYFFDPAPLCISSASFSDPWDGWIDEVRVSNVVRSSGYFFTTYALSAVPPTAKRDAGLNPWDLPLGAACGNASDPCRNAPCEDGLCCLTPCGICERCAPGGFCVPVLDAADPGTCVFCDSSGACQGGAPDGGLPDAGAPDGGGVDGGPAATDGGTSPGSFGVGCDCSSVSAMPLLGLLGLAVARARRRRTNI